MKKDDKAIIVIIANNEFRSVEVFNKDSRKIIDEGGGDYDGMDIDEYIEYRTDDYAFSNEAFSYVILEKEEIKNIVSMIDLD
ncbi:MAG: hypothetical protein EVJ48_01710 [Candidatus Acidulodesulfobacterium acidiphilum]|uniref:Uncharacterized protein n=1 Tax=Candidatus Acidulodesulfobacterium acidiphilum TaxID=2597224 RepID=A0A520XGC2_9DELT|nr:MAG: hypothetical protein EVJ48_01710 [Candidatus Acidulodesulfobacterium acidiphilum]